MNMSTSTCNLWVIYTILVLFRDKQTIHISSPKGIQGLQEFKKKVTMEKFSWVHPVKPQNPKKSIVEQLCKHIV